MIGFKYAIEPAGMAYVDMGVEYNAGWHKWPSDLPPGEMEVWVYYPIKEPGEEDCWVVRKAQCFSWRAEHHDGNPFGWWDEYAEHWTQCIGVTHWMEIERPGLPVE